MQFFKPLNGASTIFPVRKKEGTSDLYKIKKGC